MSVLKTFEANIKVLQRRLNTLSSSKHHNSEELSQIDEQKRDLLEIITAIQNKILIGGEKLLEKVQLHLNLLEGIVKELKILDSSYQLLQEVLQSRNDEKKTTEEQYLTIEEQDKIGQPKKFVVEEYIPVQHQTKLEQQMEWDENM